MSYTLIPNATFLLYSLLAIASIVPSQGIASCEDFDFVGTEDPGGSDLCDPFTDAGLVAGVRNCSVQSGQTHWCCDGAECTCFCHVNEADEYCSDQLGETTCDLPAAYQFSLYELGLIRELCDGGVNVRVEDMTLSDVGDLKAFVVSENFVSSENDLEELTVLNQLDESFFFQGFNLWYGLASEDVAIANFELAAGILDRLFDELKRLGNGNTLVVQSKTFDAGQSDRVYIYDIGSKRLIVLTMSCG